MQLAKYLAAFALCASLTSCKSGPLVTVCVVDHVNQGLQCVDPNDQAFFLKLEQADNYVCFSPRDTQKILEACKKGVE